MATRVVYRLGRPSVPSYHRDGPAGLLADVFAGGGFYCCGSAAVADAWRDMGADCEDRVLYRITLADDAVVLFWDAHNGEVYDVDTLVDDLEDAVVYTDFGFGDGLELSPEQCQIVALLDDIVDVEVI